MKIKKMLKKFLPNNIVCPHCGYVANCSSNLEDEDLRPVPGDPNICVDCVELSLYDDDLQLRLPTTDELNGFPEELKQEIAFLQNVLMSAKVRA